MKLPQMYKSAEKITNSRNAKTGKHKQLPGNILWVRECTSQKSGHCKITTLVTFFWLVGYGACYRLGLEDACSMVGERPGCDCASHHWTTPLAPGSHTTSCIKKTAISHDCSCIKMDLYLQCWPLPL